jgi:phage/plasmid-associated DNA primase
LKESDKLNESTIKAVTGGDAMNNRGIQKTDATLIPTANLFVLTNQLASYVVDKAIQDRIVLIPCLNTFETNKNFEADMMAKREQVFCYIMKHGVIQDKFALTEEMMEAKKEYEGENASDSLADFIESNYDRVEYDTSTKETIANSRVSRDSFRTNYNDWCRTSGMKLDTTTHTKFTKRIKLLKIATGQSNNKVWYFGLKRKPYEDEDDYNNEDDDDDTACY